MFEIDRLHLITQDIPGISHSQLAEEACRHGIHWVQLRMKEAGTVEWKAEAIKTKKICEVYGAKLIINDNPYLAKEIRADGIHLGKTDMDPLEAREITGNECIIGATANTYEDVKILAAKKVNYIGLGPFRFTNTKANLSPVLGIEGYKKIIEQCCIDNIAIPIIAIGGILPEDSLPLTKVGVHGIAVASAINMAKSKLEVIEAYKTQLKQGVTL